MFEIQGPAEKDILREQHRETAYYFSGCAEAFLRKHGLIHVRRHKPESDARGYSILLRGMQAPREIPRGPAFFEGPFTKPILSEFKLHAKEVSCKAVKLFDACRKPIGVLRYSTYTARAIPTQRGEISEPYLYRSPDPLWNRLDIPCQILHGNSDWKPVAFAQFDDHQSKHPVALQQGKRIVFGLPIFDLIAFGNLFPPLEAGYYSMVDHASSFPVETWLAEWLVHSARANGIPVFRVASWPKGFSSAFTIRHDYDRPINDESLEELLTFYRDHNVKSTWFLLTDSIDVDQARRVVEHGHEVALHTVAASFDEFRREVEDFSSAVGFPPRGYSAHGGLGSLGYVGERQHHWAETLGLTYGEMLGKDAGVPHPVHMIRSGIPRVGRLVIPPAHRSLDKGTKPEAHKMNSLLKNIPGWLSDGTHVIVLNHPDIHREQLYKIIDRTDRSTSWNATLFDAAQWWNTVNYHSRIHQTPHGYGIELPEPTRRPITLKVYDSDGSVRELTLKETKDSFRISLAAQQEPVL
ncbi:MAG: polysaccharide deacetylase family protein [Phycisphaerae bacterium]|nr:polysaccharide deacetylase family protein [Phycisphaerae bacterium]